MRSGQPFINPGLIRTQGTATLQYQSDNFIFGKAGGAALALAIAGH